MPQSDLISSREETSSSVQHLKKMTKNNSSLVFVAFAILFTFTTSVPLPNNFKLIILHNNDLHGRFEQTGLLSDKCRSVDAKANKCFGGFARIAHKVREFRKKAEAGEIPKILYLNAGDTYTGTPWFSVYKERITSDFLNLLQPDAIVSMLSSCEILAQEGFSF